MTRTTRILFASTLLATISATPALAAEPGFYLGAGLGRADEEPRSVGINVAIGLFPTSIVRLDPEQVEIDESDVAWSATVGYRINSYVAAEVEYMDFGTTDITETYRIPPPPIPQVPTITRRYSTRVTGPALSVLGTIPVGKRFDVFLRAGVLFADREMEINQSVGLGDTTFGSSVWLAGAGVDMSLASRWSLRLEYQRTGETDESILVGGTELERVALSVLFRL
jgi:opacity protein-like surface antigen